MGSGASSPSCKYDVDLARGADWLECSGIVHQDVAPKLNHDHHPASQQFLTRAFSVKVEGDEGGLMNQLRLLGKQTEITVSAAGRDRLAKLACVWQVPGPGFDDGPAPLVEVEFDDASTIKLQYTSERKKNFSKAVKSTDALVKSTGDSRLHLLTGFRTSDGAEYTVADREYKTHPDLLKLADAAGAVVLTVVCYGQGESGKPGAGRQLHAFAADLASVRDAAAHVSSLVGVLDEAAGSLRLKSAEHMKPALVALLIRRLRLQVVVPARHTPPRGPQVTSLNAAVALAVPPGYTVGESTVWDSKP